VKTIALESFAKVNRSLRVLGRRPDGYHEIDTIFQTVDLTDEIKFFERDLGIALRIDGSALQVTEENLVLRAANELLAWAGVTRGANIHLSKRIPIGGGLGGGSSNAAATLLGLSALWNLQPTDGELSALAASLGSDVPFFLFGGRARGTGRGETLEPQPDGPEEWVVLVFPGFSLSTAVVYGALAAPALTDPAAATNLRGSGSGGGPDRNDLEPAAESLRGELRRFRAALSDSGATSARLSGSGSTVFGLFGDEESARRAVERLAGLREETKATMTIVKTVSRAAFARRAKPSTGEQRG
jgi:4-diphosphocytidyl-2-C-methyl-D-erythritol kinase